MTHYVSDSYSWAHPTRNIRRVSRVVLVGNPEMPPFRDPWASDGLLCQTIFHRPLPNTCHPLWVLKNPVRFEPAVSLCSLSSRVLVFST